MTTKENNFYDWLDAQELAPQNSEKQILYRQLDFLNDMFDE